MSTKASRRTARAADDTPPVYVYIINFIHHKVEKENIIYNINKYSISNNVKKRKKRTYD